ncbi:MAG: SUMF1/EgtB/PvdO family nonheme iron enzyme, partial [Candidatus Xenobia bacterium]
MPEWPPRRDALQALVPFLSTDPRAREALRLALHDPVDSVSFLAIALAGEHRVLEVVPDLMRIVGRPSWFASPAFQGKPVGIGAAIAKHALLQILGTRDPGQLAELEAAVFQAPPPRNADLRDAVYVPGGAFKAGGRPVFNHFHMDTRDHPPATETLPGFWIDRHAVSNRRYREFLDDVGDTRKFCHPDAPAHRDLVPSHWKDPRFADADLPVVGIDWYAAWEFANWAGGMLPAELEWEKAARGTDGRAYPWGAWDAARANHVERALGRMPNNLHEHDELLRAVSDTFPEAPLLPVDALPEGDSPYGVRQMSGNVWEMTRTNFVTRQDMNPFLKGRSPAEYLTRPEALYTIRGGA